MSNIVQFPAALSHQAALTPEAIARFLAEYADGQHPITSITRELFDVRWAKLQADLERTWDEHRHSHAK